MEWRPANSLLSFCILSETCETMDARGRLVGGGASMHHPISNIHCSDGRRTDQQDENERREAVVARVYDGKEKRWRRGDKRISVSN